MQNVVQHSALNNIVFYYRYGIMGIKVKICPVLDTGSMKVMQSKYLLPISSLLAAALVSGSLIYTSGGRGQANVAENVEGGLLDTAIAEVIRPVGKDDRIRGSASPKITIIEYSDTECPYCKVFHETMHKVMQEYGEDVAWVYRQFPIEGLHSQALEEAIATECVAKLGGNDAFWMFVDKIYEVTPSNDRLDLSLLPEFAELAGVAPDEFESCLSSGETWSEVQEDLNDTEELARWMMQNAGRNIGTPFSVVITKDESFPLPGAQPYEGIKAVLEQLLAK